MYLPFIRTFMVLCTGSMVPFIEIEKIRCMKNTIVNAVRSNHGGGG